MKTKILPRTTVCVKFPINVPIWNGNNRCVGLDVNKIADHNHVTISYERKSDGIKIYPYDYYFNGARRKEYPIKKYKFGDMLIVPIKDLELLVREGDREPDFNDWLNDSRYAKSKEDLDRQ